MNIKTNWILLILHLAFLSVILKKILLLPFIVAALLFLFAYKLPKGIDELIMLCIALLPFPSVGVVFLAYLPFMGFGNVFAKPSFLKSYLMAFGIGVFSTLLLYLALVIWNIPLHPLAIAIAFFSPACVWFLNQKKVPIYSLLAIKTSHARSLLLCIFALFAVGHVILTSDTLFMSNGTWFYSKYEVIISSIKAQENFPFYWPNSAQGEHLYTADAPGFFSHLGFLSAILFWIPPVLFFNTYSMFLLLLCMMGILAVLDEVFLQRHTYSPYLMSLCSIGAVLSFVMVQYLESVKQFFAHPLGLLVLAIILSNTRAIEDYLIAACLWILMFTLHPAQSIGTLLMAGSIFLGMQFLEGSLWKNRSEVMAQLNVKRKLMIVFLGIIVCLPLFYGLPLLEYQPFMRQGLVSFEQYPVQAMNYLNGFVDQQPLSLQDPDVQRIDDKQLGAFFSVMGVAGIVVNVLLFRSIALRKANIVVLAFALHFVASSFAISMPFISNIEYGYRTVIPYLVITLFVAIGALCNEKGRLSLAGVFVLVIGMFITLPNVQLNLKNIHSESMISGKSYSEDIEFLKKLPTDGRIITYGHYGNAVDPGLAVLTEKYFSRYEFKQFDTSQMLYESIHSSHSWGDPEYIVKFSDLEFANKLRIGGYRYLFLNVCHPSGQLVAQKLYPVYTIPLYQNKCTVILALNNSAYAEKINVVSLASVNERLKEENGYWNHAIWKDYPWYHYGGEEHDAVRSFSPLSFSRISDSLVQIHGAFEEGEWVVFKEQYFPRWKASMQGVTLEVMSTTDRLLAIKTHSGSLIVLENHPLPIERLSALISLITILSLLFVIARIAHTIILDNDNI